jgi:hypothetical protein
MALICGGLRQSVQARARFRQGTFIDVDHSTGETVFVEIEHCTAAVGTLASSQHRRERSGHGGGIIATAHDAAVDVFHPFQNVAHFRGHQRQVAGKRLLYHIG